MRAMVFGDTASGKSMFAERLGEITGVPVVHLDQVMESVGRGEQGVIGEIIREEARQDEWIIEGNAFTKDETFRLERATHAYAFDYGSMQSLALHVARYGRIKTGREERIGSNDASLNLPYFLSYIFKKFPPRKAAAIELARDLETELVIFRRRSEATRYLDGHDLG